MMADTPETGRDGAGAGHSADGAPGRLAGADETRDTTVGARRDDRLLQCRACGRVLPEGQRKYCLDGQGAFDEEHGVACRTVGPHLEFFREHGLLGTAAAASADLTMLGSQVTAVLDVFSATGPIETLRATLTGITGHLQQTVTEALGERDRARDAERIALGEADAEQRLRGIAERQATEAIGDRQRMETERDRAVDRQHDAEKAKRDAEKGQARAEGERDTQRERAERAERQLEQATQRISQLEAANTELATRVESLTGQLDEANARADRERDRADEVVKQTEQSRAEMDRKVEEIRAEADAAVTTARQELTTQAERHAGTIQQLERARADELRIQDQQLLAAQTALERVRRDATAGLTRLLRTAARDAEPDALRQGVQDLLEVLATEPDSSS